MVQSRAGWVDAAGEKRLLLEGDHAGRAVGAGVDGHLAAEAPRVHVLRVAHEVPALARAVLPLCLDQVDLDRAGGRDVERLGRGLVGRVLELLRQRLRLSALEESHDRLLGDRLGLGADLETELLGLLGIHRDFSWLCVTHFMAGWMPRYTSNIWLYIALSIRFYRSITE